MANAEESLSNKSPQTLESLFGESKVERVMTGFLFTEGPVWHPDGYLLFTDIPASRIYQWCPEKGKSIRLEPTHNANGLTLDKQGGLLACEHSARRVSRTKADGTISVVAESWQGKRLNSPNDVAASSKGIVYFTDPPYGVAPGDRELDFQGVYMAPTDGDVQLICRDMNKPNGLALSLDESILYVTDTDDRLVKAIPLDGQGKPQGEPYVFGRLDGIGADGMKVDSRGNLFVTGPRGVWIWDKEARWIGLLETPENPSNCVFGGADGKTLFITAVSSLYRIQCKAPGGPSVFHK